VDWLFLLPGITQVSSPLKQREDSPGKRSLPPMSLHTTHNTHHTHTLTLDNVFFMHKLLEVYFLFDIDINIEYTHIREFIINSGRFSKKVYYFILLGNIHCPPQILMPRIYTPHTQI